MFKQFIEYVRELLFLARDVREQREEIEKLRTGLEELTVTVRQQAFEIQRISEREQHEREKFMLKVENALLRFERQLATGKESRKSK